jgi:hypothetical protein
LSGGPVDRFVQIDSYLHVYLERDDLRAFDCDLRLVKAFAHYTGDRREEIRSRYQRVHDDVLYEKQLRWVRRPARSPARARPALCIDRETDD